MTFEDAMASLGDELGLPLETVGQATGFEVAFGSGSLEPMPVSITAAGDGRSAVFSADLGELPDEGLDELLMRMLEANHLFEGTGGAALSVEDGCARLERRVGLDEIGRSGGTDAVRSFLCMVGHWADVIAGRV